MACPELPAHLDYETVLLLSTGDPSDCGSIVHRVLHEDCWQVREEAPGTWDVIWPALLDDLRTTWCAGERPRLLQHPAVVKLGLDGDEADAVEDWAGGIWTVTLAQSWMTGPARNELERRRWRRAVERIAAAIESGCARWAER